MKKKNSWIYLSILLLILVVSFTAYNSNKAKKDQPIKVSGIEFTPNVYLENGEIVGIDTEIVSQALENAGLEYEISLTDSWTKDFNETIAGPNRALLTTGYSPERKDSFKWAGPTSQGMYGIFAKGESSPDYPLSIEDSMKLDSIAVVSDWLETITLEELGFENLVYFDTYNEALSAFMNDELNYIASDFFHLNKIVPEGYYIQNLHVVTRYRTVFYYLAFSKDVSDEIVNRVQEEINKMVENQTTNIIVQRYFKILLPEFIPGTIQLFTEVAPPYNYQTGLGIYRKAIGSSVEIINEIQKRNSYVNKINVSTWVDAYSLAQYLPNSAVFTVARTPEREELFQWVGPISVNQTYFYTLANSGISIDSLEEAKNIESIATPNEWYSHDFLRNNDFDNIVASALTSEEVFHQLIDGEVDALLLTDIDVKWLANENNVSEDRLRQNIKALEYDGYIAFSLDTSKDIVKEWQSNLDDMKADGTFEMIWNEWFQGVSMP